MTANVLQYTAAKHCTEQMLMHFLNGSSARTGAVTGPLPEKSNSVTVTVTKARKVTLLQLQAVISNLLQLLQKM